MALTHLDGQQSTPPVCRKQNVHNDLNLLKTERAESEQDYPTLRQNVQNDSKRFPKPMAAARERHVKPFSLCFIARNRKQTFAETFIYYQLFWNARATIGYVRRPAAASATFVTRACNDDKPWRVAWKWLQTTGTTPSRAPTDLWLGWATAFKQALRRKPGMTLNYTLVYRYESFPQCTIIKTSGKL